MKNKVMIKKQTSLKLRENLNLSGLFFCLFEIYVTKFVNIIVQSHFDEKFYLKKIYEKNRV